MRITVASRIFEPEPSAASNRLRALIDALVQRHHEVTVLTVLPPKGKRGVSKAENSFRIKRFPVLRDSAGYVRGYLQYLSFDIPLLFRLLFQPKQDVIVVEPPPTSGVAVCIAALFRRTPYVYYAADIWSDAASQATSSSIVLRVLRRVETYVMQRACVVFSVSEAVTARLRELGITSRVITIGNGINTAPLQLKPFPNRPEQNHIVYAGTASEWHGAEVFIQALQLLNDEDLRPRLSFIGGGSERTALSALADELGLSDQVDFHEVMEIQDLVHILQGVSVSVASVKPLSGYDFAFPTKLYTSVFAGAPVLYVGAGPAVSFVRIKVAGEPLGIACDYVPEDVACALRHLLAQPFDTSRREEVHTWASQNVSLEGPARRAVETLVTEFSRTQSE